MFQLHMLKHLVKIGEASPEFSVLSLIEKYVNEGHTILSVVNTMELLSDAGFIEISGLQIFWCGTFEDDAAREFDRDAL